jgi:hypothetical protein
MVLYDIIILNGRFYILYLRKTKQIVGLNQKGNF